MTFEENLKTLDELVKKMESGELKLDEMITAFEQGRALVKTCRDDLESIRLRIEKVTANDVEPVAIVKNAAGENDIAL